jgi:uncharacterized repeat protein (TIGR01451 family)
MPCRIDMPLRARSALLRRCLAGALWCAAAVSGAAQAPSGAPPDLIVSSTLERIVAGVEKGGVAEVEITSGTVASHADQLIYSVMFTNASARLIDGVRITSPVPADVKYVQGSASGPGSQVLFSVDNARTFGRPDELRMDSADGRERIADAAYYTHVRWVLDAPLGPGAFGFVRFRAVPR